ncbi:MAG: aldehyde ferredoxin oxidoreductase C-terminal domain-containing protein, partial [Actinobacteria bacterium]|nr:aldehyde ferredoxin oxidoreductase C-terminal domain-containing protein [Actinomycetota bacterium]
TFGDVRGYLEVPRLIAFREGIGAELSEGVRSMARKYGGAEFAMHVKGLELPGYDPRGSWGMGLAYATSDRGGCHMRAWPVASEAFGDIDPFTSEGKAKLVIDGQHYNSVKFSLILCDFWGLSLETMAAALSAVTGDHYDASDMEAAGERIYNLSRTFNAREGFTAVDDSLPARLFSDPLPSGVTAGKVLPREEFDRMLAEYYRLRSWDENGIPSRAKLAELGLDLALLDDTEGVQAGTQ